MKKALKWTGIAILLLVVLPLLVGAAINAFDDTLDAKAAAAGEPRAAAVAEAENGYIAVLALSAGDGADGPAYARARVAEMRAAGRENRQEKPLEAKRAKRPDLCDAAQVSCLAAVQDQAANIAVKLEAYKEDLERYEKLIALRAYEEILDFPLRFWSAFPSYHHVAAAQRAYLVRAALAVQDGKIEDALSAVERDIAFQRVMLGGARTLIGKMVTVNNYRRDLAFVTDLLQSRAADVRPFAPRLTEMLKPIAPATLRLDAALDTEYGTSKQEFKNPQWPHDDVLEMIALRALRFFYKPNATINKAYGQYLQSAEQLRKPPSQLIHDGQTPAAAPDGLRFRDYIDNPVGNILLEVGRPSFVQYMLRLHDLDAYNRLLGLGVEIIAADAGAEGVADVVAKSDARFHDPYSGKPMAWDAGSRQLSFKGSNDLAKRKFFNLDKGRVFLRI